MAAVKVVDEVERIDTNLKVRHPDPPPADVDMEPTRTEEDGGERAACCASLEAPFYPRRSQKRGASARPSWCTLAAVLSVVSVLIRDEL